MKNPMTLDDILNEIQESLYIVREVLVEHEAKEALVHLGRAASHVADLGTVILEASMMLGEQSGTSVVQGKHFHIVEKPKDGYEN